MRLYVTLFLSLLAGLCHASLVFDGKEVVIPADHWLLLDSEQLPDIEALAANIEHYPWISLTGHTRLTDDSPRILRLDMNVTYHGPQKPLLVIPYAFLPNIKVGVVGNGKVLMWRSLHANMEPVQQPARRSFGMVELPITRPGDYQLLIQARPVANAVIVRGAKLNLDQNFILRDYPAAVSTASAVIGALSTFFIFCFAIVFYRFKIEFVYALIFLTGAFGSILLREGVLFLSWNLDASWWVVHMLPLSIGLCNAGAMFYVYASFSSSRWQRLRKLVLLCGWVALTFGISDVFFVARDHQLFNILGFVVAMIGITIALLMIVARAWGGGLRERLFALFIGPYFAVSLGRFLASTMQATVNIPVLPLYASFYLFGTYVFVEYLVTLTREYVDERTRQSADLTRIDLVNRFSHELRTPLNAVIGLADLMKDSQRQDNVENYANMIQTAGQTLLGLVNDILDFSKLGATGVPLAQRPVRLDHLVAEVFTGFLPQAMETHIIPVVDLEPDVPFFLIGDELRLKQIFSNLVNNAIKFSPAGELVTVTIKRRSQDGDKVELICCVSDKGRGIPEEKQAIIFEPYSQADPEDGRQLRGTGLGLAICKLLIEQMGGQINVHSELGEGATFTFNLWLQKDADAPDLDRCFASLRDKRILITSELPSIMELLPRFLSHFGANVKVIHFSENVPADHYDLVILDSIFGRSYTYKDWIIKQSSETVIEILGIQSAPWISELGHSNVHSLLMPVPLLNLLALFVEHMTGQTVDLGEAAIQSVALKHKKHSILLVDDNVVNLTVASKLLESLGVRCDTAQSGQKSLEKQCAGNRYTLVLLDCEMPGMNGFETCRRWRAYELENHQSLTPIVALTAHALSEVRDECLEAGMEEVLYKPIGRNAMIELLNRYSDQRREMMA